jgi:hypothetical protein
MDDVIQISLRGTEFLSSSSSVKDFLYALVKQDKAVIHQNGQIYIDRNPFIFHHILDYYNGGEFHLPKNICPRQAQKEIEFWKIPSTDIPSCCYDVLYNENEVEYTSIEKLESDLKSQTKQSISPTVTGPRFRNCVARLRYKLLEAHLHPFSTWTGRVGLT